MLITAYNDAYTSIGHICGDSIQQYGDKNRLNYLSGINLTSGNRPFSFQKIDIMNHILQTFYEDYVLWIDADAMIINMDFDITTLFKDGKDIYLSQDINGINCGVMIWKNTQFNINILNKIWSMTEYDTHPWWEQAALIELIANDYEGINSRIEYIPQNILNAYDYSLYNISYEEGQINENSFIIHFPGLDNNIRLQQMQKYESRNTTKN